MRNGSTLDGMRRDPALSYRGALQLLGDHDRPVLGALDKLLGGAILASPLSPLAALWGWVDQKGQAVSLVRKVLDVGTDRLLGTRGYHRQQLLTAANTVLAVTAFFEALADLLGAERYKKLGPSAREKLTVASGSAVTALDSVLETLYSIQVPLPLDDPGGWFLGAAQRVERLVGLLGGDLRSGELGQLVGDATARYRSACFRMAGRVPEYAVWLTMHAVGSVGDKVDGAHRDVLDVLAGQGGALKRVEELLALAVAPPGPDEHPSRAAILQRTNWGVLRDPIVAADSLRHVPGVRFPSVGAIYIDPRYRSGRYGPGDEPSREDWWEARPAGTDLDLFLAGHLMSPATAELPVLLLGHPGAGKSLLTKVLAARLPVASYTVIRVPLRRVDADAPVYEQIQQALHAGTHRRVDWAELADETRDTIRVVLLDGLDELLQATASGRPGYLQEVAEFQRREADQERPVVVLVTSRTVVADRVRIPAGTTLVRLEEFDDAQVADWLARWNHGNAGGAVRALTPEAALAHPDLARQPLLLMMLALYAADPAAPPLDDELSTAALYGRLLDNFVRRQVTKTVAGDDVDRAVRVELWRLGVAAFAMFNRGRQDIGEAELGADLVALDPGDAVDRLGGVALDRIGQRTIGQFFFVYTAEADAHRGERSRQAYEFLHATFGEFLVAYHVVELLDELAQARRESHRGGRDIDDDLLFALLSHEPLAARPNILTFAAELLGALPEQRHTAVDAALEALAAGCRHRRDTEAYSGYRPRPVDRIRELAAYSANLASLRAVSRSAGVSTERLATDWPGTVRLWRAGLDDTAWTALASALDLTGGRLVPRRHRFVPADYADILQAQLIGDVDAEQWLRWGLAADRRNYASSEDHSVAELRSFLVWGMVWGVAHTGAFVGHVTQAAANPHPAYLELDEATRQLLARYLALNGLHLPYESLRALVALLLRGEPGFPELAIVVAVHPRLLVDLPELADVRWYRGGAPFGWESWLPAVLRTPATGEDDGASVRRLAEALERRSGPTLHPAAVGGLLRYLGTPVSPDEPVD